MGLTYNMAWIASHAELAQTSCGDYWRVALAVACHESANPKSGLVGDSAVAHNARNLHGIKAVYEQARAGNGVHRLFLDELGTWQAFGRLMNNSEYYSHVRNRVALAKANGANDYQIDRVAIHAMANPYCVSDPDWPEKVTKWLDLVHEVTSNQE